MTDSKPAGKNPLKSSDSRRRRTALLMVSIIFLLGIIVGIVGTHIFYAQKLKRSGSVSEMMIDARGRQIAHELELDADQRQALERILEGAKTEVKSLRADIIKRLFLLREDSIRQIDQELTDEQREKFKKLREQQGDFLETYLGPAGEQSGPG